jgi:hypothetical protein
MFMKCNKTTIRILLLSSGVYDPPPTTRRVLKIPAARKAFAGNFRSNGVKAHMVGLREPGVGRFFVAKNATPASKDRRAGRMTASIFYGEFGVSRGLGDTSLRAA